jgi:hypothetical protein
MITLLDSKRIFAAPLMVILVVVAASCSSTPESEWDEFYNAMRTAAPHNIRFGGAGIMLGNAQQAAYTPERFFQKVSNYLKDGRIGAAERFIHRYPDVSLDILRSAGMYMSSWETLSFIGIAFDRLWAHDERGMLWKTLLRDRYDYPDRYIAYDRERKRVMTAMHNGHFQDAYDIDLVSFLPAREDLESTLPPRPGVQLDMDAWHIRAVLETLLNQPGQGAESFANAIAESDGKHHYHACYIRVLLANTLRKQGKLQAGAMTWAEASSMASTLLKPNRSMGDPTLWETLSYAKPIDLQWPEEVGEAFNALMVGPWDEPSPIFVEATPDRLMHSWIARWRLNRNEGQSSLLAARRAEALSLDPRQRDSARLLQARALVQIGQDAPASSILASLVETNVTEVSHPAYALLGTLSIQSGRTRHGMDLLRQALEGHEEYTWEGQAEAEADLGLANLILNEPEAGLMWLRRAQSYFESINDVGNLLKALQNEWEFLDYAGEDDYAEMVEARIEQLKSR